MKTVHLYSRDSNDDEDEGEQAFRKKLNAIASNDPEVITCHCERLTVEELNDLAEALEQNTILKTLLLEYDYNISDDVTVFYYDYHHSVLQVISKLIKNNQIINDYTISNTVINKNSAALLAKGLSSNKTITGLTLSKNSLKSMVDIIRSLAKNTALNRLEISFSPLDDDSLAAISDLISNNNNSITFLNLDASMKGPFIAGGSYMPSLSHQNCKVTHFSCGSNVLGDFGVGIICAGLKRENSQLSHLILEGSNITDNDCMQLAEATIDKNNQLKTLNISSNIIGPQGISALAEAMSNVNFKINSLILSHNRLNDSSAQAIAHALEINSSINNIDLSNNDIGDLGANALLEALKKNKSITMLRIDCSAEIKNQITLLLVRNREFLKNALVEAAKPNPALTENQQKTLISHLEDIETLLETNKKFIKEKLIEADQSKTTSSSAKDQQQDLINSFDANYTETYKEIIVQNIREAVFNKGINFILPKEDIPAISQMMPLEATRNFKEAFRGSKDFRDYASSLKRERNEAQSTQDNSNTSNKFTKMIEAEQEAPQSHKKA